MRAGLADRVLSPDEVVAATRAVNERRRRRRWRAAIALAYGLFAIATLVNLGFIVAGKDIPTTLGPLIDVRRQLSVPAFVVGFIEVLAGILALALASVRLRRRRLLGAATWATLGLAAIVAASADLTHPQDHLHTTSAETTLAVVLLWSVFAVVAALVALDLRSCRTLLPVWALAVLMIVSNPVTEAWKHALVSDPANYTFVAAGLPARFNDDAWRRLNLVEVLQETTEAAAAFLTLSIVLAETTGRRRRR